MSRRPYKLALSLVHGSTKDLGPQTVRLALPLCTGFKNFHCCQCPCSFISKAMAQSRPGYITKAQLVLQTDLMCSLAVFKHLFKDRS